MAQVAEVADVVNLSDGRKMVWRRCVVRSSRVETEAEAEIWNHNMRTTAGIILVPRTANPMDTATMRIMVGTTPTRRTISQTATTTTILKLETKTTTKTIPRMRTMIRI